MTELESVRRRLSSLKQDLDETMENVERQDIENQLLYVYNKLEHAENYDFSTVSNQRDKIEWFTGQARERLDKMSDEYSEEELGFVYNELEGYKTRLDLVREFLAENYE